MLLQRSRSSPRRAPAIAVALALVGARGLYAQRPAPLDTTAAAGPREWWPTARLGARVAPRVEAFLVLRGRVGLRPVAAAEEVVGLGAAEEVGSAHVEAWAERSSEAGAVEYRGMLTVRLPVTAGRTLRLSTRPRVELHELAATPFLRIGDRVQLDLQRLEPRFRVRPYLAAEPSFDSRYRAVNRLDLVAGAACRLAPGVSFDAFLLARRDTRAEHRWMQALGTALSLRP